MASCDILYVITDLKIGGVPLHLYRLALAMRDRGKAVRVISLAPNGPVGDMLVEQGIEVESCRAMAWPIIGGWDVRVIPRLARLIRTCHPRLIHAMLFHANLASRWACKLAGFPTDRLLCEIQTVEIERRWHLWVDRFTHRACRLTIGNSPSVIDHLAKHARIPRSRLRLVRGGIDPQRIQNAIPANREPLGIPKDTRIILWVGRLDPIKGLQGLLQAYAKLKYRGDVVLLLAGQGPLRRPLERLAGELGVSPGVRFLGSRQDVPSLLKIADVFAFPSQTEGLPNALLEAMAAAVPIVTTDAPGCRDLISHERTGLVVPCGDAEALALAIKRLLDDPALAVRLAKAAREEVSTKWHYKNTLDAYDALYHEIIASHS